MNNNPDETQELLDRAQRGEQVAFEELFTRHRARLRKAIALRPDRRPSPRVDASDVLQETYLEAAKRLPKYFEQQEMPFYLWLRFIARPAFQIQHTDAAQPHSEICVLIDQPELHLDSKLQPRN